jgi:putative hemolysin
MWKPLAVAAALVLAGCASQPPTVVKTNGPFVTVTRPQHADKAAAKEVAQRYCDKLGKHAEMLSTLCGDTTCPERELIYWCH